MDVSCNLGYSDEILHSIGQKLPGCWKKLGINLGIPLSRLDQMTKVKYTNEMALEMFQAWWSQTTTHSRWGELHYALVSVSRHDLLQETQKYFKDHDMDYNDPDQMKMERVFFKLSERIPTCWKDIGIHLGVPLEKISAIGQQPIQDTSQHAFQVLKMWQAAPSSSHHQLIRVMMDDMSRGDVTRFILKQFERPRQGRTVCDCNDCDN